MYSLKDAELKVFKNFENFEWDLELFGAGAMCAKVAQVWVSKV